MQDQNSIWVSCLRWGSFCLFLGRGWQHAVKTMPYESLWDISWLQSGLVGCFLLCAVFLLLISSLPKDLQLRGSWVLWVGAAGVLLASYASYLTHNGQLAQLWEHSAQFSIAGFYFFALREKDKPPYLLLLKVAIALTFLCHGLFAAGLFYPTPANFVAMSREMLPLSAEQAMWFLRTAGYLDLLVVVGIFVLRISKPLLLYATVWGSLTALARVGAYVHWPSMAADLLLWMPETVLRVPHAILPLVAYLLTPRDASK